jgi:hypothetical protein
MTYEKVYFMRSLLKEKEFERTILIQNGIIQRDDPYSRKYNFRKNLVSIFDTIDNLKTDLT